MAEGCIRASIDVGLGIVDEYEPFGARLELTMAILEEYHSCDYTAG